MCQLWFTVLFSVGLFVFFLFILFALSIISNQFDKLAMFSFLSWTRQHIHNLSIYFSNPSKTESDVRIWTRQPENKSRTQPPKKWKKRQKQNLRGEKYLYTLTYYTQTDTYIKVYMQVKVESKRVRQRERGRGEKQKRQPNDK